MFVISTTQKKFQNDIIRLSKKNFPSSTAVDESVMTNLLDPVMLQGTWEGCRTAGVEDVQQYVMTGVVYGVGARDYERVFVLNPFIYL